MSESKLKANRENAQKSTGPRTEEGKRASSGNALRHGLCSRQAFIPEGREERYEELYGELLSEVRPAGELEIIAFEKLIHAAWRMELVRTTQADYERECESRDVNPFLDDESERRLSRLEDYLRRAESAYARAFKELRLLQTDRLLQEQIAENIRPEGAPALGNLAQVIASRSSYERSQRARENHENDRFSAHRNPPNRDYSRIKARPDAM
jgi:hypothetical protein